MQTSVATVNDGTSMVELVQEYEDPMRQDKAHPRNLLTSDQAAEFLGVNRSTIKRWVDNKRLRPQEARPSTPFRRGAMYFSKEYLESKLVEWAEESVRPASDTEAPT